MTAVGVSVAAYAPIVISTIGGALSLPAWATIGLTGATIVGGGYLVYKGWKLIRRVKRAGVRIINRTFDKAQEEFEDLAGQ